MVTLDLKTIRYINLLDRESNVKTSKCFLYNNVIIFAVPENQISKAIGHNAENVRRIQEQLGKRVKIIAQASGIENAERFIKDIISPVSFKSVEIKEGILVLTAGMENKASLIGRNRRREEELKEIIKNTFNIEMKIA